jgi:dTDP-4-amino-4,6-dideoxygalactose transaminase
MAIEQIPVADPGAQYRAYREQIDRAIKETLESGWYILGERCVKFEREFATYIGAQHCSGVANGTDAIWIALRAAGIQPGDEVLTVSHSAVATVAAIELIGAVPVFVDIDPLTRGMNPQKILPLITSRTKAVVPVHIYGQPVDIVSIAAIARAHNLFVLEDCAQAHGAMVDGKRVGTFGDAAAFSFYPTKNLGALGDGGGIVTAREDIADRVRLIRQYGWRERYRSEIAGGNSRLDELQAAILSVKLTGLERDNARRREIAQRYTAAISGPAIQPPPSVDGTVHAMHLYVVETPEQIQLQQFLKEQGIHSALHYPEAIHQQEAYRGRIRGAEALPETERLYRSLLSLPMYPELPDAHVERVCTALHEWSQRGT